MKVVSVITIVVLLCFPIAHAQRPLTVVSWNVENLFDTIHDAGKNDYEFLPQGTHRWNSGRYWRKQRDVARTIAALSDEGLPDIVALCEVENDSCLRDLTRRTMLYNAGYRYVMTNSGDPRGIDVALVFHPARFGLLSAKSITVDKLEPSMSSTRDILYVKGLINKYANVEVNNHPSIDTLHVFVVHLPSKLGGKRSKRLRDKAAQQLWLAVDSIFGRVGDEANIVVMGDFNTTASDKIFRNSRLTVADPQVSRQDKRRGDPSGTYRYRGIWQCIDHILLSPSLSRCRHEVMFGSLPWLLEQNDSRGGVQPRRTYLGPAYHGGISDHLPLLMELHL
ncbi:MAG: endonuclease/exonuclease/phosphatase family protein [Bacteroidaceae bacterium]|nr:endonuclease/exonuclease/phosphatase family protein [Bacteroidaceae bacterium]